MSPDEEVVQKDRGTVLAENRTDLAIQRTVMASERSLMAWVRTSLSMIGFGFSIYKFFQYLPEEIATGNIRRPQAPRNLGLTLIALGTLALAAAAWQHRRFLNEIGATQSTTHLFHLIRSLHACHPDRNHHVLRRFAAPWTLLAETFCRTSDLRRCFHDSTQLSEH